MPLDSYCMSLYTGRLSQTTAVSLTGPAVAELA